MQAEYDASASRTGQARARLPRRLLTFGVALAALALGVRGTQNAVANGDTRTITI
jgi:hypothetical protein